jgi:hypothetical protein
MIAPSPNAADASCGRAAPVGGGTGLFWLRSSSRQRRVHGPGPDVGGGQLNLGCAAAGNCARPARGTRSCPRAPTR